MIRNSVANRKGGMNDRYRAPGAMSKTALISTIPHTEQGEFPGRLPDQAQHTGRGNCPTGRRSS